MKPCGVTDGLDFGGVESTFRKLLDAQIGLGGELLKLLGAGATGAMNRLGSARMPKMASCCDIPDPCWMPRDSGEAHCRLAPDGTAEIRMFLTNEDRVSRAYSLESAGFGAKLVSFSANSITLGSKERTLIVATFTMPPGPPPSQPYDVVIWVHGCRDHFCRWIVQSATKTKTCCHEVAIDDGPDYVVQWYDHFYCERPCPGSAVAGR